MSAVLGYAQILQRDPNLQPSQRHAIETIDKSGYHLLGLIDDVLDLSKIEAGRLELQETDFDLKGLIDGISAMFALRCEQKGIHWKVEWKDGRMEGWEAGNLPSFQSSNLPSRFLVHGDVGKLRQVLINLLGNAVKFTDAGGVTLRITQPIGGRREEMEESTDHPSLPSSPSFPSVSHFTFHVIDTGIGIAPKDQALIFESFQQTESGMKRGGTGLGLALSKRYIELMGGELEVESDVGVGSRFCFTIPLTPATSDTVAEPSQWRHVRRLAEGYHVRALVCDDKPVNREVLSRILTDLGVAVMEAESGAQAIQLTREHHPDIVFMDIRMPGMDGLQAAQQIMAESGPGDGTTRPVLVAISASTLEQQQEVYFDAGFDDFIGKPFRFERICECLAVLLDVEFETDEIEAAPPSEERPAELPVLSLPAELVNQLKAAAEFYKVTELRTLIDAVEALGPEAQRFARRLRGLVRSYDMGTVLKALGEIKTVPRDESRG